VWDNSVKGHGRISMLGLPLEPELIIRLCEKMQLGPARLQGEGQQEAITVRFPTTPFK
jgi:hypothetical protein